MPVVITHPSDGVYVGHALDLAFWTLLDAAGQAEVVTFTDEAEAREHVANWDERNNPASYGYVAVSAGRYAGVEALAAAGLSHLVGDLLENALSVGSA
ncbi:hypothetical protein [Teichococcus vastitatis]|uniref:Uncharacterized protein n=1 Tax=Teichococcus vastitatis TaxID=2307076 RepID=A0ABS9W8C5_9PROT|nr:hypothetical protein [Pseudoroseomonas vastitatis]MCI0755471.1 hypothetical protein [Pseudoroseomonas vastitatis]